MTGMRRNLHDHQTENEETLKYEDLKDKVQKEHNVKV